MKKLFDALQMLTRSGFEIEKILADDPDFSAALAPILPPLISALEGSADILRDCLDSETLGKAASLLALRLAKFSEED